MTTGRVVKKEQSQQNRLVSQASDQGLGLSCLALRRNTVEDRKWQRAGTVWLRPGGLLLPEACHNGLMLKVKPFCISPLAHPPLNPKSGF